MIVSLYGQPASGKTCLGKLLAEAWETPFLLDGDEFRSMVGSDGYDRAGRLANLTKANAVATFLNHKFGGLVVMAFVHPYQAKREELRVRNPEEVIEVFLESTRALRREFHCDGFEIGRPDLRLRTDGPVGESFEMLKMGLISRGSTPRPPLRKGHTGKPRDTFFDDLSKNPDNAGPGTNSGAGRQPPQG